MFATDFDFIWECLIILLAALTLALQLLAFLPDAHRYLYEIFRSVAQICSAQYAYLTRKQHRTTKNTAKKFKKSSCSGLVKVSNRKLKAKPDGKPGQPQAADHKSVQDPPTNHESSEEKTSTGPPAREIAGEVVKVLKLKNRDDESAHVKENHHKPLTDIGGLVTVIQSNATDSDASKELQISNIKSDEAKSNQLPQSPFSILPPTPVDLTPSQLSQEDASGSTRSIDYSFLNNFYHFTVDENGGRLKLPFCTLFFPMMAVVAEKLLKIAAVYKKANRKDQLTQVIPAIHCSKSDADNFDAVEFDKPVHFDVTTVADWTDEDIEIQVTENSTRLDWRRNENINVTRNCNSISFHLSRFAGVRAFVQRPGLGLYHSVYVKRPTGIHDPSQHHFYVLLHSGDQDMWRTACGTLNSPANEVVIERHYMIVRPPFTFRASLSIPSMRSSLPEVSFVVTSDCLKVQENLSVKIAKLDRAVAIDSADSVPLEYKICSPSCARSIPAPFYWNAPVLARTVSIGSVKSIVVNANGDQSIGVLVPPEHPSPKISRKPRWCGSEHGFREHRPPPFLRDTSAPNLLNQNTSDSAESVESCSHRDLSLSAFSMLEQSSWPLLNPTSTPFQSPVLSGQMLFDNDLSTVDDYFDKGPSLNPNAIDSGIFFSTGNSE